MLAGLDEIDWNRLSHAYGPATDVPGLLRKLADGSEHARQEAIQELFGNIVHQGSIYEATAYAVPFLIELVQDASLAGRSHILSLLQEISGGWLRCLSYAAECPILPPAVAKRHAEERVHYRAAYSAVEKGFDIFGRLFRDCDPSVRIAAAFTMATLIDRREDAAEMLLEAIDEEETDGCRAAVILALMELARQRSPGSVALTALRRFDEILTEEIDFPDARLCAGVALLQLGQADRLASTLALVRPRLPEDMRHFYHLPWDNVRNLFALISDSLRAWPESRKAWIAEGLKHQASPVISSALSCAGDFCRELRRGPQRLAPEIARLADAPDAEIRRAAISTLGELGHSGRTELSRLSRHEREDVRTGVEVAWQRIRSSETRRVTHWVEQRPLLLGSIRGHVRTIERHGNSRNWKDEEQVRDALIRLGFHGPKAAAAVGLISGLTGSDSPWIRIHAIRALGKITRDPAIVVPLLIENLRPEPTGFLAIDSLREIGPPAIAAVPALRIIVESEKRFISWGLMDDVCASDEACCEACLRAIQAIDPME